MYDVLAQKVAGISSPILGHICLQGSHLLPAGRTARSQEGIPGGKGTAIQNCKIRVQWLDSPPVPYTWEVPLAKQHSTSALHSQAHGGPVSRLHHSLPLIDHNAVMLSTRYLCSWGSKSGTQLAISLSSAFRNQV